MLAGRVLLVACCVLGAMVTLGAAYRGHADDRDVEAILAVYPTLKGRPADSCATCHRSGNVPDSRGGAATRRENHCDFCHTVFVRGKRDVKETLNAYGAAYVAAGRGAQAVRAIAGKDADGDGFSNEAELRSGTDPGDAASNPSVPVAPSKTYSVTALKSVVPMRDVTVFLNTAKSRGGDSYSDYRGNSLWEILQAVGVAHTAASVDVLSADGYEHTFSLTELQKQWPQGPPVLGLGKAELGECGWVTYRSRRLQAGKALPDSPVLLAYEENGQPLQPARFDAATGRLVGQGPARVIVPQLTASPPDLPQFAGAACAAKVAPANRFHEEYDHNGGASAYAIVAVRVMPLPKGTRDINWQSSAARALANGEIVFFGALTSR